MLATFSLPMLQAVGFAIGGVASLNGAPPRLRGGASRMASVYTLEMLQRKHNTHTHQHTFAHTLSLALSLSISLARTHPPPPPQ